MTAQKTKRFWLIESAKLALSYDVPADYSPTYKMNVYADAMTGAVIIVEYKTGGIHVEAIKVTPTHEYSSIKIISKTMLKAGEYGQRDLLDYTMKQAVDDLMFTEEIRHV